MASSKKIVIQIFFLLPLVINVSGQSSPLSDEYFRIAEDYRKNLKPDSAIFFYEKASVEFQALGNIEKFVDSYNQIGILLTRQDQYEKAKNYLETALSTGLSSLGPDHLQIATTYISLGVIYNAEGNYDQSLFYHDKALSIRLLKLGENDAQVATSYGNIGNVYRNNLEFDKSIDAHLKAMNIREKVFGTASAEIVESYVGLGRAYKEKKEYKTSLEYFEKALKNKIIQLGEGHKDLSKFYNYISDVHYLMENKEQAEFYKRRSEETSKG